MKSRRSKVRVHPCHQCGHEFIRPTDLKKHLEICKRNQSSDITDRLMQVAGQEEAQLWQQHELFQLTISIEPLRIGLLEAEKEKQTKQPEQPPVKTEPISDTEDGSQPNLSSYNLRGSPKQTPSKAGVAASVRAPPKELQRRRSGACPLKEPVVSKRLQPRRKAIGHFEKKSTPTNMKELQLRKSVGRSVKESTSTNTEDSEPNKSVACSANESLVIILKESQQPKESLGHSDDELPLINLKELQPRKSRRLSDKEKPSFNLKELQPRRSRKISDEETSLINLRELQPRRSRKISDEETSLINLKELQPRRSHKISDEETPLINLNELQSRKSRRLCDKETPLNNLKELQPRKPLKISDEETPLINLKESQALKSPQCLKEKSGGTPAASSSAKPEVFTCYDCSTEFKEVGEWVKHLKWHEKLIMDSISYTCNQCGQQYRQINHLKSHIASVHVASAISQKNKESQNSCHGDNISQLNIGSQNSCYGDSISQQNKGSQNSCHGDDISQQDRGSGNSCYGDSGHLKSAEEISQQNAEQRRNDETVEQHDDNDDEVDQLSDGDSDRMLVADDRSVIEVGDQWHSEDVIAICPMDDVGYVENGENSRESQEPNAETSIVHSYARTPPEVMQAPPQMIIAPPQAMQAPPQVTQAPPQMILAPPQAKQASQPVTKVPPQVIQAHPQVMQALPKVMQAHSGMDLDLQETRRSSRMSSDAYIHKILHGDGQQRKVNRSHQVNRGRQVNREATVPDGQRKRQHEGRDDDDVGKRRRQSGGVSGGGSGQQTDQQNCPLIEQEKGDAHRNVTGENSHQSGERNSSGENDQLDVRRDIVPQSADVENGQQGGEIGEESRVGDHLADAQLGDKVNSTLSTSKSNRLNEKRLACKICGLHLAELGDPWKHHLTHEEPIKSTPTVSYTCDVCNMVYHTPNTIRRHMLTHGSIGKTPASRKKREWFGKLDGGKIVLVDSRQLNSQCNAAQDGGLNHSLGGQDAMQNDGAVKQETRCGGLEESGEAEISGKRCCKELRCCKKSTGGEPADGENGEFDIEMNGGIAIITPSVDELVNKIARRDSTLSISDTDEKMSSHTCSICGLHLNSPQQLKFHMKMCHAVEAKRSGTFLCDQCGASYRSLGFLERHRLMHVIENSLEHCIEEIKAEENEDTVNGIPLNQIVTMSGDTQETTLASEVTDDKSATNGILIEHSTFYVCDECGAKFEEAKELHRHKLEHKRRFPCTLCDKSFTASCALKTHLFWHSGEKPFSCNICSKAFNSNGNLSQHMVTHTGERRFACTLCDKRFTASCALKQHMRLHSGEKPFSCTICSKVFISNGNLQMHQVTHTKAKAFECTLCDKRFTASCALKQHISRHSGEKPFSCNICSKVFRSKGNLQTHQVTHTKAKAFKCDKCNKGFAQACSLKTHMRLHEGVKPYACKVCQKLFSSLSSLMSHEVTHSTAKPFPCCECDKSFKLLPQLKNHLLVLHSEPRTEQHVCHAPMGHCLLLKYKTFLQASARHVCTECGKMFSSSNKLRQHMVVHTGEKVCLCPLCGVGFSSKGTLKGHMRVHDGIKAYTCEVCGKQFTQAGNYSRHKFLHTGERPFKCDFCFLAFAQRHHLKSHIMRHIGGPSEKRRRSRKKPPTALKVQKSIERKKQCEKLVNEDANISCLYVDEPQCDSDDRPTEGNEEQDISEYEDESDRAEEK